MKTKSDNFSSPLGDILKKIVRKGGAQKRALTGRRLAQKTFQETMGGLAPNASVVSVKVGVVTIETPSSALFHELEGYHREILRDAFRAAGMQVSTVRVRLAKR